MIKKLRKKFIRIAMLSVVLVMALLTGILNAGNYISVKNDLKTTLVMISENPDLFRERGGRPPEEVLPQPSDIHSGTEEPWDAPAGERREDWDFSGNKGPFNKETRFSLRFFTLSFSDDGELLKSNLDNIASVEEGDLASYLSAAVKKGEGFGRTGEYEYYVYRTGDDSHTAVFLSAFNEIRSCRNLLVTSVLGAAACILLVYALVVLLSGKAIDPVVRSAEKQKQFITDASHELKTPLTVINTSLSVLEMEVGQQKWIDKAKGQTEKMGELVNSLVTLSRMDEEEPSMALSDVDVSAAVTETVESFRETAEQNGFSLAADIEEGIVYRCDEYMIRQLVSILAENAVKYTFPGGKISFSLSKDKKGIRITETNPCENLDTGELDKLFDRFYRSDKARTSGNGFGVGLSIAKAICEAHKGDISASSPEKDVICFTAHLK